MGIFKRLCSFKNQVIRARAIRTAARGAIWTPTLTVLGDSFVAGDPSEPATTTFPHQLATLMGWAVRYSDGQGGTGYAASPSGNGSAAYASRIDDLLIIPSEFLLISGGYNDTWNVVTGAKTMNEVRSAIDATLESAAGFQAEVIVVGPFWTRHGTTPIEAFEINDHLQRGAAERGFRFVDVLTSNWITPENRACAISSDDTHPTQAGQDYIASRLAAVLAS